MTILDTDEIKEVINPPSLTAEEIHVWHIDLDRPIGGMSGLLSQEETARVEAMLMEQDKSRYKRVRGAMRSILGNQLGVPGDALEFIRGEHGKPSIRQPESAIQFNLTHCAGMALLAVSETIPVGVDLEHISSRPSQLRIAQRLFPQSVHDDLAALPSSQQDAAFFQHWTEFEACAKCQGVGIFTPGKDESGIQTIHFTPKPGWIACVACKTSAKEALIRLKHFNFML